MSSEVSLVLTTEELIALADMALALDNQSRLNDLLVRNGEGKLCAEEMQELDSLLRKIDELNLVKARAAAALQHMKTEGSP